MRVFLTGASGFIGSAITKELLETGHQVIGLTHSDDGAARIAASGAEAYSGNINDMESLRSGVEKSDAIIHCAYMHGFERMAEASSQEMRAINNLGDLLIGSDRPLVITSVAAMGIAEPGQPATENHFNPQQRNPRLATEQAATNMSEKGVKVAVVRVPQVHNTRKLGIVSSLIQIAREKGGSAYLGDGMNRWSAAHVLDVARVYRLVLEKKFQGTFHAVAEEGIYLKEIATAIGKKLDVPVVSLSNEDAVAHFGPLAMFLGFDMSAKSQQTQDQLGWHPLGPGLIEDIQNVTFL